MTVSCCIDHEATQHCGDIDEKLLLGVVNSAVVCVTNLTFLVQRFEFKAFHQSVSAVMKANGREGRVAEKEFPPAAVWGRIFDHIGDVEWACLCFLPVFLHYRVSPASPVDPPCFPPPVIVNPISSSPEFSAIAPRDRGLAQPIKNLSMNFVFSFEHSSSSSAGRGKQTERRKEKDGIDSRGWLHCYNGQLLGTNIHIHIIRGNKRMKTKSDGKHFGILSGGFPSVSHHIDKQGKETHSHKDTVAFPYLRLCIRNAIKMEECEGNFD
ncbi:hypothetical protein RRG08_062363 [Elysia crispata]|uniref:Uncharacterized protein n=1 Tax=Elysia crispata TaxID=231223 RepID=A0AAE0YGK3_9GAST|nr:hypothetical protein RRG08_062363 [Elysia crispata]